jgi:granule-bound starch synthase
MGLPQGAMQAFSFKDGQPPVKAGEKPTAKPGVVYNKLNWLKAGILTTDKVLTVSPNYASEISSGVAKGVELDAFIRQAGGRWHAVWWGVCGCVAVCWQ